MSSSCIFVKKMPTKPIIAQTVYMITGVGSAIPAARGARVVTNLEQKFRKPNDVEQNKVGNSVVCET